MKLRGDRGGFKGIFVKRMFGIKKPRAKVPHKQKKMHVRGATSTLLTPHLSI